MKHLIFNLGKIDLSSDTVQNILKTLGHEPGKKRLREMSEDDLFDLARKLAINPRQNILPDGITKEMFYLELDVRTVIAFVRNMIMADALGDDWHPFYTPESQKIN